MTDWKRSRGKGLVGETWNGKIVWDSIKTLTSRNT